MSSRLDNPASDAPAGPFPVPFPAPMLATPARALDFGAVRKPAGKMLAFRIGNAGSAGTLHVRLKPEGEPAWFRVFPDSLSIPPGEERVVEAEVVTQGDGCPEGVQSFSLALEAPDSLVQEPANLPVRLEVLEEIRLVAEPAGLELGAVPLGEARTETVTITRSDGGSVDLDPEAIAIFDAAGAPHRAWADVVPGAAGRQQSVKITFHTANRQEMEYECAIRLADAAPEVTPVTLPLKIRVEAPPTLVVEPVTLLPLLKGGAGEGKLVLRNSGKGVLKGRLRADQAWLQPDQTSFSVATGETATIGLRTGQPQLPVGRHEAAIEIDSNDGARMRKRRVPVELAVEDPAKAGPVEVTWEPAMGEVRHGASTTATMTIRNRLGQPFAGTLSAAGSEWLGVPADPVTLAPGESRSLTVSADSRRLEASRASVKHTGTLQLLDTAGRRAWQGQAALSVRPGPAWGRLAVLVVAVALTVCLAIYAWPRVRALLPSGGAPAANVPLTPGAVPASGLAPGGVASVPQKLWPARGEIRVEGAIHEPNPAASRFFINATVVTLPSHNPVSLRNARPKHVLVNRSTFLHVRDNPGRKVSPVELKEGDHAIVVGKDHGVGSSLPAREVAVWDKETQGVFQFRGK